MGYERNVQIEKLRLLEQFPVFSQLLDNGNPRFRASFPQYFHRREYKRNQIIFKQGDIPKGVHFIEEGDFTASIYLNEKGIQAEIKQDSPLFALFQPRSLFRSNFDLARYQRWDFFGDLEMFSKNKRLFSVKCTSMNATTFEIDMEQLTGIVLSNHPETLEQMKELVKKRSEFIDGILDKIKNGIKTRFMELRPIKISLKRQKEEESLNAFRSMGVQMEDEKPKQSLLTCSSPRKFKSNATTIENPNKTTDEIYIDSPGIHLTKSPRNKPSKSSFDFMSRRKYSAQRFKSKESQWNPQNSLQLKQKSAQEINRMQNETATMTPKLKEQTHKNPKLYEPLKLNVSFGDKIQHQTDLSPFDSLSQSQKTQTQLAKTKKEQRSSMVADIKNTSHQHQMNKDASLRFEEGESGKNSQGGMMKRHKSLSVFSQELGITDTHIGDEVIGDIHPEASPIQKVDNGFSLSEQEGNSPERIQTKEENEKIKEPHQNEMTTTIDALNSSRVGGGTTQRNHRVSTMPGRKGNSSNIPIIKMKDGRSPSMGKIDQKMMIQVAEKNNKTEKIGGISISLQNKKPVSSYDPFSSFLKESSTPFDRKNSKRPQTGTQTARSGYGALFEADEVLTGLTETTKIVAMQNKTDRFFKFLTDQIYTGELKYEELQREIQMIEGRNPSLFKEITQSLASRELSARQTTGQKLSVLIEHKRKQESRNFNEAFSGIREFRLQETGDDLKRLKRRIDAKNLKRRQDLMPQSSLSFSKRGILLGSFKKNEMNEGEQKTSLSTDRFQKPKRENKRNQSAIRVTRKGSREKNKKIPSFIASFVPSAYRDLHYG